MKQLTEQQRLARNEYQRKYRARNKIKVAEYMVKTWTNKLEALKQEQEAVNGKYI